MSHSTTLFIGLDVHKNSISVAYATENPADEVIFLGPIDTRLCDIDNVPLSCGRGGAPRALQTA